MTLPETHLLARSYRGRKVLITGHTGFKGAWLALWLSELGANIHGIALDPPTRPNLFDAAAVSQDIACDQRLDLLEWDDVQAAVKDAAPEIVFHLAAQSLVRMGYQSPRETFGANVMGTVNLLDALRHCPSVRAVVVVTSDKCYDNPETAESFREHDPLGGKEPYSASKAAAEIVCEAYRSSFFAPANVALATARAGNVIGGGDWAADRIIPDTVRAVTAGRTLVIRNPDSVRPWQHVLDALHGYLILGGRLLEDPHAAGPYNFGPDRDSCRTVRVLVEKFLEQYGTGTWEPALQANTETMREAHLLYLDPQKAMESLNWRPVWDLPATIHRTSQWYRKYVAGDDAATLCMSDIREFMNGV